MTDLTNMDLDPLIETADKIYDEYVGTAGDYDKYHEICSAGYYLRYDATIYGAYEPKVIDDRVIELAKLEIDERVV